MNPSPLTPRFPTDNYLNRERGLLAFNRRVLAQAQDDQVPLLERLRFLCIVSSNLDEFFEVRMAGLKEQVQAHSLVITSDGKGTRELMQSNNTPVRWSVMGLVDDLKTDEVTN